MTPFTVIIPSRNAANLLRCVQAIHDHERAAGIIVVDDGLDASAADVLNDPRVRRIEGVKPFIFARNANLGIVAAGTDDVILCNDDALLETPNGFTLLAETAAAHPECGVMSAATNKGAPCQRQRPGKGVRYDNVMVAFVCVFISRGIIERIGMLDERFGLNAGGEGRRGYGCDDDDLCWRVRGAGLKLGICDAVHVDHKSLKSTFRHDPEHPADVKLHEALFEEKWGRHPRNP